MRCDIRCLQYGFSISQVSTLLTKLENIKMFKCLCIATMGKCSDILHSVEGTGISNIIFIRGKIL